MISEERDDPTRVAFLYWGRRGLTQFVFELASAAVADRTLDPLISVSRQNDEFDRFASFSDRVFAVDTFSASAGAVAGAWRIPRLREALADRLRIAGAELVIDLMPHVWSVAMEPAIRSAGATYAIVAHDAESHPGDYRTRWVKNLIDRPLKTADIVFTLSEAVSNALVKSSRAPRSKIITLFHPELTFGAPMRRQAPMPGEPLRLLFLGRIMPYKGLTLFLDAVERLRRQGCDVEIGVFGDGPLGADAQRINAGRSEVVNRWLSDAEIAEVLPRFHAIVLSHTEASQSGVAATALGAGLPVIATPVGGLREQIRHEQTGVLAERVDAEAIADAAKSLLLDRDLYARICATINATREERSMSRFVRCCVDRARDHRPPAV